MTKELFKEAARGCPRELALIERKSGKHWPTRLNLVRLAFFLFIWFTRMNNTSNLLKKYIKVTSCLPVKFVTVTSGQKVGVWVFEPYKFIFNYIFIWYIKKTP